MRELNPAELEHAYRSVTEHYIGGKLTEKRMLAAYMRAIGLVPNGEAWMMAKHAFESGYSFEEAASFGLDFRTRSQPSVSPHGGQDIDGLDESLDIKRESAATQKPVEVQISSKSTEIAHASNGRTDEAGKGELGARQSFDALSKAVNTKNGTSDMVSLQWFPKICGPGDLIGDGARKLLGQPKVSPVALLVRETAQNSWDARVGPSVRFCLNLRRLNTQQLDLLRTKVLVGDPGGITLRETLDKDEVWVLEISDRGTKGLGGPIRPDLPVPAGQAMDFVNMVFNIGAPSDRKLGGGTYGFGKAVGYLTSGCGTTLIWSHSNELGTLESRLIGSAIGNNFEDDTRRYTGRHWWGVPSSTDSMGTRVEPLRGHAADTIGGALFEEDFDANSTGTSILIIDPQLGGASYAESAQELAQAVLWNLWPKMVPLADGTTPMEIDIRLNGEPVPIVAPKDHPYLRAYATCLEAVRAMHEGGHIEMPLGLTEEVRSSKPKRLLGYLALTRFTSFGEEQGLFPDISPLESSSHHVCLMRHAELVVTYDEMRPLDSPGYHWAAVFQPVEETDSAFSASEPPAHDEWIPHSIADKAQKSAVTVALRRIKEICNAFAAPPGGQQRTTSAAAAPTIDLANALGGLVASLDQEAAPENDDGPQRGGKNNGKRRRKPAMEIQGHHLVGIDKAGRIGAEISLVPRHSGSGSLELKAEINAVDEARRKFELDAKLVSVEWQGLGVIEKPRSGSYTVVVTANSPLTLRVHYPADVTLDVDFSVSEL